MNENARVFLENAYECLADADVLMEKSRYTASVSRSYYAMFHAAQVALLNEKIEAYTHSGVNVQFQKAFIKSGIFPVTFGKTFSKILDQRLKSDYEIGFKAFPDDARHTYQEALDFINAIRDFLNDQKA